MTRRPERFSHAGASAAGSTPSRFSSSAMIRLRLFTLAALSVGLTACLNSTLPDAATVEGTTFASSLGVDLANSTQTPSGLYYRDLTVGTGATLAVGQVAKVYYVGYLSTGVAFDSLQAPAAPLTFTPGNRELIAGFEEGVIGMKIGGRRQLLIPPTIAFGFNDSNKIPGNSVVVFNVEAVNPQ